MLFTIDRVQYDQVNNRYYFFEFMKVENIQMLMDNNGNTLPPSQLWQALFKITNNLENYKIEFLKGSRLGIIIFIFYQQNFDKYIKVEINPYTNKIDSYIWDFLSLQNWFRRLNNLNGQANSKGLGTVRENDIDTYVNEILQFLYNNFSFYDDNGLDLTKRLLKGDTTKGFDLDLFHYIPSTNEYIIFEFLKRENEFINNIQAHPMRYCWTGKWNDNKQKFISLWNIKQYLNARLFLINYSDNTREKLSVIEVLNIDINRGITSEKKYCMSKNVFLSWLIDMQNYCSNNPDYLSDFNCVKYDQMFFQNFNNNKQQYGAEFTNIYI